tara:strand:+ start:535 stop:660 length:126 start_codon:yes stop_codon:yes gene_type:complete
VSIIFKKIPYHIKKNKLKSGVIFGLSAYWGLIVAGTLINFN